MRGIAALSLLALAVPAAAQEPALPSWMAGCWQMVEGESWADECWMAPRNGVMLGAGRSGTGSELTAWEAMQIIVEPAEARERAEPRMTFWASPNGNGRTAFELAPSNLAGITFVNRANDYPQRIRYWREGELLKAEISLADGSRAQGFSFVRAGGP
jgi:hypothetical protein